MHMHVAYVWLVASLVTSATPLNGAGGPLIACSVLMRQTWSGHWRARVGVAVQDAALTFGGR